MPKSVSSNSRYLAPLPIGLLWCVAVLLLILAANATPWRTVVRLGAELSPALQGPIVPLVLTFAYMVGEAALTIQDWLANSALRGRVTSHVQDHLPAWTTEELLAPAWLSKDYLASAASTELGDYPSCVQEAGRKLLEMETELFPDALRSNAAAPHASASRALVTARVLLGSVVPLLLIGVGIGALIDEVASCTIIAGLLCTVLALGGVDLGKRERQALTKAMYGAKAYLPQFQEFLEHMRRNAPRLRSKDNRARVDEANAIELAREFLLRRGLGSSIGCLPVQTEPESKSLRYRLRIPRAQRRKS